MDSNSTPSTAGATSSASFKPESNDIGWEYGVMVNPANTRILKCIACGKKITGGITRLKEHIAHISGNVRPCLKATVEAKAKCLKAIKDSRNNKDRKRKRENEVVNEVQVSFSGAKELEELEHLSVPIKNSNFFGPMDQFARAVNPDVSTSTQPSVQMGVQDTLYKQRERFAHQIWARWVYEDGIPFNCISSETFLQACIATVMVGTSFRTPTQHLLRESLLEKEVERTKGNLKKLEDQWKLNGCSVMTDAWSDRKRRSVMNLCVNCVEGTSFISSMEDSTSSHTGKYIFDYVDKHIEEIGPQYVVQVVTDNATNNMAAANLLKQKRPSVFWTSCATHTINLMLEGIGKLPYFKSLIGKAKSLTIFIYAHTTVLALMRKYTDSGEIVRPGVTRFATAFLTLQSLYDKKEKLKHMFISDDWIANTWSKKDKGINLTDTILNMNFWSGILLCLKVFEPLVKVLRLVDGDKKPSMGFIYGELLKAREEIKEAFNNVEVDYNPILAIIEEKSRGRLDTPLHLAGYFLNPYYLYKIIDPSSEKANAMDGFLACVERMYVADPEPDKEMQIVNKEIFEYLSKEGNFDSKYSNQMLSQDMEKFDPVRWWTFSGNGVLNLKTMALRVLSLTTSSSGCERNWSTFESVHTKKRNRLESSRLNNLVFVKFNNKLLNKRKREKEQEKDVLTSDDSNYGQEWKGESRDKENANDDDFNSESEIEENVNEM